MTWHSCEYRMWVTYFKLVFGSQDLDWELELGAAGHSCGRWPTDQRLQGHNLEYIKHMRFALCSEAHAPLCPPQTRSGAAQSSVVKNNRLSSLNRGYGPQRASVHMNWEILVLNSLTLSSISFCDCHCCLLSTVKNEYVTMASYYTSFSFSHTFLYFNQTATMTTRTGMKQ